MSMLHLLTEETKKLKFMKKKPLSEFKSELFGDDEKIGSDISVHRLPVGNHAQSKPEDLQKDKNFEESLPSTSSGASKLGKYTSPLESLADSG